MGPRCTSCWAGALAVKTGDGADMFAWLVGVVVILHPGELKLQGELLLIGVLTEERFLSLCWDTPGLCNVRGNCDCIMKSEGLLLAELVGCDPWLC